MSPPPPLGAPAPVDTTSASAAGAPPDAADVTRTAGRGGLALAGAKVSFIIFGFIQQLILPYLLGGDGYGKVSRVLVIVSIINNVTIATSIQGVSRAVSRAPAAEVEAAFARTLRVHVVVAMAVSTIFAATAGWIADAIGAAHVTTPLRLAAAVVMLYGVYGPLVGALNGRRRFLDQAGLDVGYGMLRTASVAAGALLFLRFGASGVVGAIAGFVFAAVVIVPVAISRAGLGKVGSGGPSTVEYLGFLGPLAVGQIFLNLLFQTDFMLLSRALGQAAGDDSAAADRLVGAYRGVQLFSFLPYQMLVSINFILFPMLARAHAEGDRDAVKRFVGTGVRLAFILTGMMCGTVSALAPYVLRFAFPANSGFAENGADALRISSLGMGAFAILGIVSAALTSLKRERTTAVLTAATVAMVAAGCLTVIPRAQFGPQMLTYAATVTACVLLTAAVVGGFYLRSVAGGFVRPLTLVRVLIATAVVVILGPSAPWLGKPAVLVEAAAMGAAYLVVLVVLGELGKDDLATVRRALGRRR